MAHATDLRNCGRLNYSGGRRSTKPVIVMVMVVVMLINNPIYFRSGLAPSLKPTSDTVINYCVQQSLQSFALLFVIWTSDARAHLAIVFRVVVRVRS